jgi:phage tail sheath protein FI
MPGSFTYPGVYVEEIPGVHAIAGVPTSIAAFIGWAARGPTGRASLVQSWAEFQAWFGGLNANDGVYLGYAVNQYFANGGQQAYIIRLVWDGTLPPAPGATPAACASASATGVGGGLTLFAASPGLWGNAVAVAVIATPANPGRFGLQVSFGGSVVESFADLSIAATDARYAASVIDSESNYVSFIDPATNAIVAPTAEPTPTAAPAPLSNGLDGAILVPASEGNFEAALASNAGMSLLDQVDVFNLLCVPGETDAVTILALQDHCARRRAFYIVDPPRTASFASLNASGPVGTAPGGGAPVSIASSPSAANSAYYFPWVLAPDPLSGGEAKLWPPCGFVAGVYAATDSARGVWKAPAGAAAALTGEVGLQYALTDIENGDLNSQGINCLRHFAVYGDVIWGARTLLGADQAGSQWKYAPVRRLALFLESSLDAGLKWVVFEPNGDALWAQIRTSVGAFMQQLFVEGAFQGETPAQAYFVKCDATNNPPSSVDPGVVNVTIGFAPLYPAEFEVIQIQRMLG